MKLATWLVPWLNKGSRDTEVHTRWVRTRTSAVQKEKMPSEWRYIVYGGGKALFMSGVRVDRQIGHYDKATGSLKTTGYNQILHHLQIPVLSLRDPPTILLPFLHKIKPIWANWTLESLESINDLSYNQQLLLLSILTDSLFATIFDILTGQATIFFF